MMSKEERAYVQKLEGTIISLQKIIKIQADKIIELERRLGMNSTNSSKPPSSDGLNKPNPKSLRKPSGKKPGGQKGHKGATLSLPHDPDRVIECRPSECAGCPNNGICKECVKEKRYLVDIKISTVVHEYDQIECVCVHNDNKPVCGTFPQNITGTKQYGSTVKALIVALSADCTVSVNRVHSLLTTMTGLPISTGFVQNTIASFAQKLDPSIAAIKEALVVAPVLHADETGVRVNKKLAWLHSASNSLYTYQTVSEKRGTVGMNDADILPRYRGALVHDCWQPYWAFDKVGHALCCAHIMRELQAEQDNSPGATWAQELKDILLAAKQFKEALQAEGRNEATQEEMDSFKADWLDEIQQGMLRHPVPHKEPGKRGRVKKGKTRCLLERLEKFTEEIFAFLRRFDVPFDNNQAERDVRHAKVKLKVSGCFRTLIGAQNYAKICSVLSTLKKQHQNILTSIMQIFETTLLPNLVVATE